MSIRVRLTQFKISIDGGNKRGKLKGKFLGQTYEQAETRLRKIVSSKKELDKALVEVKDGLNDLYETLIAEVTPEREKKFSQRKLYSELSSFIKHNPNHLRVQKLIHYLPNRYPNNREVINLVDHANATLNARRVILTKIKEQIKILTLIRQLPRQPTAPPQANWVPQKSRNSFVSYTIERLAEIYDEIEANVWWPNAIRWREMEASRIYLDVLRSLLLEKPKMFTWETRRPILLPKPDKRIRKSRLFDRLRFTLTYIVGMDLYYRFELSSPRINERSQSVLHTRIERRKEIEYDKKWCVVDWRGKPVNPPRNIWVVLQNGKETYKSPLVLDEIEKYRPWIAIIAIFLILFQKVEKAFLDQVSS